MLRKRTRAQSLLQHFTALDDGQGVGGGIPTSALESRGAIGRIDAGQVTLFEQGQRRHCNQCVIPAPVGRL